MNLVLISLVCIALLQNTAVHAQERTEQSVGFNQNLEASAVDEKTVSIISEPSNAEREFSARIIGGALAESGAYPSMVALIRPGFGDFDGRLFCGGTVVDTRWVMTAAHCLFDSFDQPLAVQRVLVVEGTDDLAQNDSQRVRDVAQIIIHPDFDITLDLQPFDIALLELTTDSEQQASTLFAGDTTEYVDRLAFIAGWGATNFDDPSNPEFPTLLHDASVPIIHNGLCNAPRSYNGAIVPSQVCAGFENGRVDACVGDSGGPMYINEGNELVQVGITSFGIGCAEPFFYGIYTDISHFLPWLSQYIPVPEQTDELRDQLANPEPYEFANDSDDKFAGLFRASVTQLTIVLLGLVLLIRCSAQWIKNRRSFTKIRS